MEDYIMDNVTIQESFTLPSKGKIYGKDINPNFRMRSMTTEDEMKRLSPSENAYEILSQVIDSCVLDPIGVSAYDMHLGDYQYLLHRLRVVTYGPEYRVQTICPECRNIDKYTIDLDSLDVQEYDEEIYKKYSSIYLPGCKKTVELKFQTPRILDQIAVKKKEAKRRNPDLNVNLDTLYNVQSMIKTVDGQYYDPIKLEQMVRKMSMGDTARILQAGAKLNTKIGLKAIVPTFCTVCGVDYNAPFRITGEFFGPTFDE